MHIPKRIAVFGASTVYGRIDSAGGFVARLRLWHESLAVHHTVFNLGISGETTTRLLQRFLPEAQVRTPDLIIFALGLNDTSHVGSLASLSRTGISTYEQNIRLLIKQARTLAPMLFIGPYPIDDRRTQPIAGQAVYFTLADAHKYAQVQQRVCREEDVAYLDVMQTWEATSYHEWLAEDGLHANSAGHEQLFQAIRTYLETSCSEGK
ncbi:MAG TPA: GDSL-type esterase/lipase family protein [bacterium]|nr:GDSL-type esterase/lipase family protein [bacterium]